MNGDGTLRSYIDVGESDKVATRIANHNRKQCWKKNSQGRRAFAVLYTDNDAYGYRRCIERDVRDSTSPPCGEFGWLDAMHRICLGTTRR